MKLNRKRLFAAIAVCGVLTGAAVLAQTPPPHLLMTVPGQSPPIGTQDAGIPRGTLKNCLLGLPSSLCPLAMGIGQIAVAKTSGGPFAVTNALNEGLIEVRATAPSTIAWTCDGTLQGFTVKDMLGTITKFPITLQPTSGTIEGFPSVTISGGGSAPVSPPFMWFTVLCDTDHNSVLL